MELLEVLSRELCHLLKCLILVPTGYSMETSLQKVRVEAETIWEAIANICVRDDGGLVQEEASGGGVTCSR